MVKRAFIFAVLVLCGCTGNPHGKFIRFDCERPWDVRCTQWGPVNG